MPTFNFAVEQGVLSIDLWPYETKQGLEARMHGTPRLFVHAKNGTATLDDVRNYLFAEEDGKPIFRNRNPMYGLICSYVEGSRNKEPAVSRP